MIWQSIDTAPEGHTIIACHAERRFQDFVYAGRKRGRFAWISADGHTHYTRDAFTHWRDTDWPGDE